MNENSPSLWKRILHAAHMALWGLGIVGVSVSTAVWMLGVEGTPIVLLLSMFGVIFCVSFFKV